MAVVLMVAEKPSLARSLAEILSKKQCRRRKSACSACDVYEFDGAFPPVGGGARVTFKMTSVCGHVMSLDFQPQYNKWEQIDPVDLFDAETMKKESMPNLRIPYFLRSEGKGVDYLVLWLDCDKEGENICFEVMEEVEPAMRPPRNSSTQTVYRARFSSITESAVLKAFAALGHPDWNEARSVDARMELDLRIGCAFTRFQTMTFQTKYAGLSSSVISYGPCQTPTLGFCVHRHDEILQFKSEKYWKLAAKVNGGERGSPTVALEWDREGLFDKEVALLFLSRVQDCKDAVVLSVSDKPRSKAPPIALHTVELLRAASSKLHIGPKLAMDYAERLYTEGYISYPRTETTKYPKDFDFRSILSSLGSHPEFGEHASSILQTSIKPPSGGVDVGDHPPITPMRSATRDQLRDSEWKIYDFVTRHFLATGGPATCAYWGARNPRRTLCNGDQLMPECKYKLTEVELAIGSERFHWTGATPTSPGFTAVYPWQEVHGMETNVVWNKDQHWNVDQMRLSEHETTPPGYLTESELITLMEKHGIGTDASIPVHIENICSRNYVHVDSGRRLVPTKLGVVLVHGYQKIDPQLVQPTMRSAVEEQLILIAKGKADYGRVLQHTLDIFRAKFEFFRSHIEELDELFEASFSSVAETGRPLSRCGKCQRYLKFIAARPQRMYCPHCNQTYSLPQGGSVKLYKEIKCPLDDFELLVFSSPTKSYLVCPYCYNQPPFKGVAKGMGCNQCPHQSCLHAMPQARVDQCSECDHGTLVLEPYIKTGGPAPKWKISCNTPKCRVMYEGFAGSSEVHSSKERCGGCGSSLLTADMSRVAGATSVGGSKVTGCWECDDVISNLVVPATPDYKRGTRGRGRKRGRGRGVRKKF